MDIKLEKEHFVSLAEQALEVYPDKEVAIFVNPYYFMDSGIIGLDKYKSTDVSRLAEDLYEVYLYLITLKDYDDYGFKNIDWLDIFEAKEF